MNLAFSTPWLLALLPLAIVALRRARGRPVRYASLDGLPADPLSQWYDHLLRWLAAAAIVTLILGASGLHKPAFDTERIGAGAQIVLLLDRSRSMDEPFAARDRRNVPALARFARESKGSVARRLLHEFVSGRRNDLYAMTVFSTRPIPVLTLTDRRELVQASITAGNVGRGLASTDIGDGLVSALEFFEGREFAGSRLVMLISDGGARLDLETRIEIEDLLARHRVSLYWIYLRSVFSPGIAESASGIGSQAAPARALHEFFDGLKTPYRVYDAEDPQALQTAIADVNRLQSLPIRYRERVPRRDLAGACYAVALPILGLLLLAQLLEMRAWKSGTA